MSFSDYYIKNFVTEKGIEYNKNSKLYQFLKIKKIIQEEVLLEHKYFNTSEMQDLLKAGVISRINGNVLFLGD